MNFPERPPQNDARDLGEWPHGWQHWASSAIDAHYRRISMLTGRPASRRAHLCSHSGHIAGVTLSHAPTAPEYTVPPHLFRVLLLERLGPLCQSLRPAALGVTNSSIREAATLPLVHEQGGCANGPLQPNGCWPEFVGRQGHASGEGHERSCSWPKTCLASVGPNMLSTSHCGVGWGVQGNQRPRAADIDGPKSSHSFISSVSKKKVEELTHQLFLR